MVIHSTADVSSEAIIEKNVKIWHQAQVREGAVIGENVILAKGTYIGKDVIVGANCKIQNNSSIYQGVVLEKGVFIGPHTVFTNDLNPRAINPDGSQKCGKDWQVGRTLVKEGAAIGARSVILPNITIGRFALIGAGSVVTKNVPDFALVYGNPARIKGYVCRCGRKLEEFQVIGETCFHEG